MLHLGSIPLDDRPRVVIALRDTPDVTGVRAALEAGADVLEFRVDQFQPPQAAHARDVLRRFAFAPRLLTIRSAREGGGWQGDEQERADLFEALIPDAEAVDIELSATSIRDRVVAAAHAANLLVIGSYHDFDATPAADALNALVEEARRGGVDLLKVAATCRTPEDLRRLARFTLDQASMPVVVIGMGAHGTPSRLFFPALGSRLTYTFLGEPTAPGQLHCEDMLKYLGTLYPASGTGKGKGM